MSDAYDLLQERDATITRLQGELDRLHKGVHLMRAKVSDLEASLETETARCTRLVGQLAAAERRALQPGDIVYRPVIEEGKPAVRPPKHREYFMGTYGQVLRAWYYVYMNPRPIVRRVDVPEATQGEAAAAAAEPYAQAMRDVERYGLHIYNQHEKSSWYATSVSVGGESVRSGPHDSPLEAIQDVVKKIEAANTKETNHE